MEATCSSARTTCVMFQKTDLLITTAMRTSKSYTDFTEVYGGDTSFKTIILDFVHRRNLLEPLCFANSFSFCLQAKTCFIGSLSRAIRKPCTRVALPRAQQIRFSLEDGTRISFRNSSLSKSRRSMKSKIVVYMIRFQQCLGSNPRIFKQI
jgi:hypothetical protein